MTLLLRSSMLICLGLATAAADVPLGLDAFMRVPEENPLTPKKIQLGRKLFFDVALSRDRSVSCATCHDPKLGFTDDRPLAIGIGDQKGTRRSPRLVNRGYGRAFFWDGRASSLEQQVLKPIENPIEMDLALDELMRRLAADEEYTALFEAAFERSPDATATAYALASYLRTIVSGDSPYDRFVAGDFGALDPSRRRGLEIFRGKGGCTVCHLGPNLTDEEFHNTGVGWTDDQTADVGREIVTGSPGDRGAFKTPTLREVALSGPYMHDGSLETLEDVVDFYDDGGVANPALDMDVEPLGLSDAEKADLAAFLEALNGEIREGLR